MGSNGWHGAHTPALTALQSSHLISSVLRPGNRTEVKPRSRPCTFWAELGRPSPHSDGPFEKPRVSPGKRQTAERSAGRGGRRLGLRQGLRGRVRRSLN